jgi:trk system potassium uptake protein
MKVIIVGCGRLGAELATRLFQSGNDVSVVDSNEAAFSKLPANFEGRLNEGDAISRDVLHRAGIERVDALAAVMDSDVLNGVVGHLARSYYHVTNVIVRNHDPRYRPILEAYGLQVVSALSWGAQRIEEMIFSSDVRSVFSPGNGEVEIYEVAIPEAWDGRMINELVTSSGCILVSVTRAGRAALPASDLKVETGDVIHVSATLEGVEALRSRMRLPK